MTRAVLIGGVVTGPLFGWFGHQWRNRRSWVGAAMTAAAICAEPLAHRFYGIRPTFPVASIEIAAGMGFAAYVVLTGSGRRRATP